MDLDTTLMEKMISAKGFISHNVSLYILSGFKNPEA
jgi:hypothetical protein